MELQIVRTYFSGGINGSLFYDGHLICLTIELPLKENQRRASCIPEGKYRWKKRYSRKFGWHLEIMEVKNRSLILLHPANNATKELMGCIAQVTHICGAGLGTLSHDAFERVKDMVYKAINDSEDIWLTITS
ncbi:DUF5675 family protein [Chryseobacterium caseinilyticum]|uniref:DUF5675 domain-containing protein n=1 Tax=Chryseobacterium caseinilyticum TaxID=2771428 RepID=A0ABR8ZH66_9FLAO|nr:DUF5675 family protein [Chryseobacterium caseinilyticum]MBD8084639.1 hypothetical protein [Chryseobacterium caseinilyticum]